MSDLFTSVSCSDTAVCGTVSGNILIGVMAKMPYLLFPSCPLHSLSLPCLLSVTELH